MKGTGAPTGSGVDVSFEGTPALHETHSMCDTCACRCRQGDGAAGRGLSVAAPTIEAALDGRFLSGLKEERRGGGRAVRRAGRQGALRRVGAL